MLVIVVLLGLLLVYYWRPMLQLLAVAVVALMVMGIVQIVRTVDSLTVTSAPHTMSVPAGSVSAEGCAAGATRC